MKTKRLFSICCMLIITALSFKANAQFLFKNLERLANIKEDTTFFLIQSFDANDAKAYEDVFNKYWTLSKIAFVTKDELSKHDLVHNYTMSVKFYSTAVDAGKNGSQDVVGKASYPMMILRMDYQNTAVLFIDIYCSLKVKMVDNKTNLWSLVYGWGAGYLKNYIQLVNAYVENSKGKKSGGDVVDNTELPELRNHTLYVPDYMSVYLQQGMGYSFSEKNVDVSNVMSGYKYNYKVVSAAQIDKMISDSTNGIYYMILRNISDKYFSIVDSKTGNIVYSTSSGALAPINDKDMKKLSDKIDSK